MFKLRGFIAECLFKAGFFFARKTGVSFTMSGQGIDVDGVPTGEININFVASDNKPPKGN